MYPTVESINVFFLKDKQLHEAVFSFKGENKSGILNKDSKNAPILVMNASNNDVLEILEKEYNLRLEGYWPVKPKPQESYLDDAKGDACDTAENYLDEIVEALMDKGEASDDLNNDYLNGDSYHHENHVDRSYSFEEACKVLEELDEYEETDSGLWQGQDFKEAASTCAAYTYGGAVYFMFKELIEDINTEYQVEEEGITEEAEAAVKVKGKGRAAAVENDKKGRIKSLVEERIKRFRPE